MKTTWNFKLLYKNDTDPQIEKDLVAIETGFADFEKKYRSADFTATPEALAQAFDDRDKLSRSVEGDKPWWYFALQMDLNSENAAADAKATKFEQRIVGASNKIKFFGLKIAEIPKERHDEFLNHPALKEYKYTLTKIFKHAVHNLSEKEEQLDNLLSQTSYSMWIDTLQKLFNQQVVKHKGKNIPIVEAMNTYADMPTADRRKVYAGIVDAYKNVSDVAEAEINAVYNYKKTMDKRRGYARPYSATIMGYQNDEKAIEDFVALVTKNFKISQRFYKIHATFLSEKKITMADRGVPVGKIKTKFDFKTSVTMLRSVLERFDREYLAIFDSFLENGQIDVYPKKGKKGGAYCWGQGSLPTFVFLNHTNDIRSLETLAHEMGHAFHTELSKKLPPRYRKYSTATAEVASTFFEQLISEEVEKRLSDKEKIILLHNKVMGDVVTIFRQIACFNFELALHEKIRTEGKVSKDTMADLMAGHLKSYLGNTVQVSRDDGYSFVSWSHIRRFFYVYTYAYGQLISRALYEAWKKDHSFSKKIKQFLSVGGSMSPEDIFKSIGIDTTQRSFFEAGLASIEKDIERLERMVKNRL